MKLGPRFRLFSTPTGVLASPFRGVVPIPDAARKHGVGAGKNAASADCIAVAAAGTNVASADCVAVAAAGTNVASSGARKNKREAEERCD